MKKIMCFLLGAMLFFMAISQQISAAEVNELKIFHEYTVGDDAAVDEWYTVQKGAYLLSGECKIARADGYYVNIYGSTKAVQDCDKVQLKLYVERSTSSSSGFTTYKSYSYSANDAHQITKEIVNIQVERGYYYRIRGVHTVTEGSTTETTSSVTSPLSYI